MNVKVAVRVCNTSYVHFRHTQNIFGKENDTILIPCAQLQKSNIFASLIIIGDV